jgi:hypothetical protein
VNPTNDGCVKSLPVKAEREGADEPFLGDPRGRFQFDVSLWRNRG